MVELDSLEYVRLQVARQRANRERSLLLHHLIDTRLHFLVQLVQVCRSAFRVPIEVARALAMLVLLRFERLVQAGRFFEGCPTRNLRRRVARIAGILVGFVDFLVGSNLHSAVLGVQNRHCVPADERSAAIIGRAGEIVVSLLVRAGELSKHISLHRNVLHHVLEDCIGDFSGCVYIVTDFFKYVLVHLEFLIVNRQLSSVHQDLNFLPISLDHAEVRGQSGYNFSAQFSRH